MARRIEVLISANSAENVLTDIRRDGGVRPRSRHLASIFATLFVSWGRMLSLGHERRHRYSLAEFTIHWR